MRASWKVVLPAAAALLSWTAAAAAQQPTDCGFYSYVKGASEGRHCAGTAQAPPPQRVTAICRDRSYSFDPGSWACLGHGGVHRWLR